MPRGRNPQEKSPEQDQFSLLWRQLGRKPQQDIRDLDIDAKLFLEAALWAAHADLTMVIKSARKGESLGLSIWTRRSTNEPTWFQSVEEVEEWLRQVVEVAARLEEQRKEAEEAR